VNKIESKFSAYLEKHGMNDDYLAEKCLKLGLPEANARGHLAINNDRDRAFSVASSHPCSARPIIE